MLDPAWFTLPCMTLTLRSAQLRFPGSSVVKNPPANAGDTEDWGLIPGSGISPADGNGKSLQYSCLDNPMDRGACWALVHGIPESLT